MPQSNTPKNQTLTYYFEYTQLVAQQKTKPLLDCANNHQMLHPHYDTQKNKLYFQCLTCDQKVHPGQNITQKIKQIVNQHQENNP